MTQWYMMTACCAAPAENGLRMQHMTRRRDKHTKTPSKAALTQKPWKEADPRGDQPAHAASPQPTCMAASTGHEDKRDPPITPMSERQSHPGSQAEELTGQPAHAVKQVLHGSNKLGIKCKCARTATPK